MTDEEFNEVMATLKSLMDKPETTIADGRQWLEVWRRLPLEMHWRAYNELNVHNNNNQKRETYDPPV